MSDSSVLSPDAPASESSSSKLPISSIVRAVCEAAKRWSRSALRSNDQDEPDGGGDGAHLRLIDLGHIGFR